MSFTYNNETWKPQTAEEHADKIIDTINQKLQQEDVRDEKGNVVQLNKNFANALYLIALGDGNRLQENDEKLSRAINSFNIALCDDQQIENLLPIAAISRNPGSYSTLRLTVTAESSGNCVIPAGTRAAFNGVYFVVQESVVVSAGATQTIDTRCDTLGPVAVLSGEITAFETSIANLASVINNESSVPGVAAESTNSLRQKLMRGDTIKSTVNGCKSALEELTGVAYARVYFNYNTTESITLPGGVELAPRHAYIVVHGESDKIAEVYTTYETAETQNSPIGAGTYSRLTLQITAAAGGDADLPGTASVTYNGHKFVISEATTVNAGETKAVEFICDEWGPFTVPEYAITELDEEVSNVDTVVNLSAAIPGTSDPRHSQNWTSSSGQTITIYYDTATEQNVFVKIWLKENAESGEQVENQIKRDLLVASAGWTIGETITQLNTGAPFINCTYTDVAYTEISLDGVNWASYQEIGCNSIPRISDATISVDQLGD